MFVLLSTQCSGSTWMIDMLNSHPKVVAYSVLFIGGGSGFPSNVLDVLISRETAAARDVYHARRSHKLSPCRIRLDAATLIDRLTEQVSQVEKASSGYRNMELPLMEVCYEELSRDRDCFSKVLVFLGVDPVVDSLSTSLKKINSESHHELIENYAEVRETLRGTAFECFLR